MKFKNFIFKAWKVMEFNIVVPEKSWKIEVLFGRFVIADFKARTMCNRDETTQMACIFVGDKSLCLLN